MTSEADAPSMRLAARTELHGIATLTLSDRQFLRGETDGKPTVIAEHHT